MTGGIVQPRSQRDLSPAELAEYAENLLGRLAQPTWVNEGGLGTELTGEWQGWILACWAAVHRESRFADWLEQCANGQAEILDWLKENWPDDFVHGAQIIAALSLASRTYLQGEVGAAEEAILLSAMQWLTARGLPAPTMKQGLHRARDSAGGYDPVELGRMLIEQLVEANSDRGEELRSELVALGDLLVMLLDKVPPRPADWHDVLIPFPTTSEKDEARMAYLALSARVGDGTFAADSQLMSLVVADENFRDALWDAHRAVDRIVPDRLSRLHVSWRLQQDAHRLGPFLLPAGSSVGMAATVGLLCIALDRQAPSGAYTGRLRPDGAFAALGEEEVNRKFPGLRGVTRLFLPKADLEALYGQILEEERPATVTLKPVADVTELRTQHVMKAQRLRGKRTRAPRALVASVVGVFLLQGIQWSEPESVPPSATECPHQVTEGGLEASSRVANVSRGDAEYSCSVHAYVDDVVKLQVFWNNLSQPPQIADDLGVRVRIPADTSRAGHVDLEAEVSSSNMGTSISSARVYLSVDGARLEYIEGSALWRHNQGSDQEPRWVTEEIEDAILYTPILLENLSAGQMFAGTLTVAARVVADVIGIEVGARRPGVTEWRPEVTAQPGDELQVLLSVTNHGNTTLRDLAVGANLAGPVVYVPGSTYLRNSNHPIREHLSSDNLPSGGIDIGSADPGGVSYVWFNLRVDDDATLAGKTLRNVAVVKALGTGAFENTVVIRVEGSSESGVASTIGLPGGSTGGWYDADGGRPGLRVDGPSPNYVVFNSYLDTPNYGDERAFFDGKWAREERAGRFSTHLTVEPGDEVLLRVYAHNNADPRLNGRRLRGEGVARNTRLQIFIPDVSGVHLRLHAYVISDNSRPQWVSDAVDIVSRSEIRVEHIPGSVIMHTNALPNGLRLGDSIVPRPPKFDSRGSGGLIGYEAADGLVPGSFKHDVIITLRVRAVAA